MELFLDTETSGMITTKKPLEDPSQAFAIQLGFILSTKDKIYQEGCLMVRGGDRSMNPFAYDVHGISIEESNIYGINELDAFELIEKLLYLKPLFICHNVSFDIKFVKSLSMRYRGNTELIDSLNTFCTMREKSIVNFCQLVNKIGRPKVPKLKELHMILFNEWAEGEHDALEDVKAMRRCYYELKHLKVI